MGKVIVIGSQKGGVGKTTTTLNLAYSLHSMGKKVLAIDFDSQANLTTCYGLEDTNELEHTIGHLMMAQIEEDAPECLEAFIQSKDGMDFIPSSIYLSVVDAKLRTEMGAERMLAEVLEPIKGRYDYVLIDTCPSLGMLTINALAAADEVIITVNPQLLAMMGLQDFLRTVSKIKKRINPKLTVAGILLTMCESRTTLCKVLTEEVTGSFQGQLRIFENKIPSTVKVGESIYYGLPIALYSKKASAGIAYRKFAKELIAYEANNKRKVFGDAVDLLMDDIEERAVPRGLELLAVKSIKPFHDHPFHLYEGERLEDMIASIKEHGVLNPVIVQKVEDGYEMLSGHNRLNAAKLAGLKEVPAIVKTGLSEEEAYVYVIETNLMQRSFSDLLISEKAAVLKARYEKESCQGRRNDIIEEIARMEGKDVPVTCGHGDQRLNTRDMIGKEYELSGSSVGRLLKLNDLIKPFKDMVDRGALYTKVALQMAFLPEEEQNMVYEVIKGKSTKITLEAVQRDVVRTGVVAISVSFSVTQKWLRLLTGYKQQEKIRVGFFDPETASVRQTEMYVEGFKAKLKKDTSYKGLWIVSFTLKEL